MFGLTGQLGGPTDHAPEETGGRDSMKSALAVGAGAALIVCRLMVPAGVSAAASSATVTSDDPKVSRDREIQEIKQEMRLLEHRVEELESQNNELKKSNTQLHDDTQHASDHYRPADSDTAIPGGRSRLRRPPSPTLSIATSAAIDSLWWAAPLAALFMTARATSTPSRSTWNRSFSGRSAIGSYSREPSRRLCPPALPPTFSCQSPISKSF